MKKSISKKRYKWILLIHQMPPKPTSIRVKVWRRLQIIGAVPIKKSVYILPFTRETHEDFQWIRSEIIAQKGDATIFKVDSIEGINDQDIIKQFQKIRNKDYDEIISKTLELKNNIEGSIRKDRISSAQKDKHEIELKKIKRRLSEIISLDFFQVPSREKAEKAIIRCDELIDSIIIVSGKNSIN